MKSTKTSTKSSTTQKGSGHSHTTSSEATKPSNTKMSKDSITKPNAVINPPKVKAEALTDVFIPLGDTDFDWSKVVITEPATQKFTIKDTGATMSTTSSKAYYPGPNGEQLSIYFQIAKQATWGINGSWDINLAKKDQRPDNMKGFQIGYPLTSLETFKNPTDDEVYTKNTFDTIHKRGVDFVSGECQKIKTLMENGDEETKNPIPTTYGSWLSLRKSKTNAGGFMKPIYALTKSINKETQEKYINKDKPQTAYLKLASAGKGSALKCKTGIYGPGDKEVLPFKYMRFGTEQSILTDVECVLHWEGIYYGAHGDGSPYGSSMKFRIVQMNISPAPRMSSLPTRRMLASNQAVEMDDDDNSDGEGGSDFQNPLIGKSKVDVQQNDDDFDGDDDLKEDENLGEEMAQDDDLKSDEPDAPEVQVEQITVSSKKKNELIKNRKKHA